MGKTQVIMDLYDQWVKINFDIIKGNCDNNRYVVLILLENVVKT